MKVLNYALLLVCGLAMPIASFAADNCSVNLDGTDLMQYQIAGAKADNITVDGTCKKFTVHFNYKGVAPKTIMGHDFVLTKSEDADAIAKAASARGAAADYLPDMSAEPYKSKVLAASTKLLGGDAPSPKAEDIVIDVAKLKAGGDYTFFCTFPGHIALMRGKLTVAPAAVVPAPKKK